MKLTSVTEADATCTEADATCMFGVTPPFSLQNGD